MIGRGVTTTRFFQKGEFVCEYRGQLSDAKEGQEKDAERGPGMGYIAIFSWPKVKYDKKGRRKGSESVKKW